MTYYRLKACQNKAQGNALWYKDPHKTHQPERLKEN